MERWQLSATPCTRTTLALAAWTPWSPTTEGSGAGMARIRSSPMPLNTSA